VTALRARRVCKNGQRVVVECGGKAAYQLLDKRDERLQVLLEREVELISLLQVDRDCTVSAFCFVIH
jgi:hypothetical protein